MLCLLSCNLLPGPHQANSQREPDHVLHSVQDREGLHKQRARLRALAARLGTPAHARVSQLHTQRHFMRTVHREY